MADAGPSSPLPGPSNQPLPANPPPPVPFTLPGRSILKQPPPPPKPFFSLSTFSKLLPSQNAPQPVAVESTQSIRATPLKRAYFILPHLSTTYTISSANPPATATTKEEKRGIEERERERRIRVTRGNSLSLSPGSPSPQPDEQWWSLEKVEQFYKECCWGRDEQINPHVSSAIRSATAVPRALDVSGIQLNTFAASAFADILNLEWGLRKLVMKDCELDDLGLKAILHSLLLPNTLSFLSVASNKNLKGNAWRLLGAYLGKATTIQFLDVSQNILDKRAVEFLVASLGTLPPTIPSSGASTPSTTDSHEVKDKENHGLVSLRMDDCLLKPAALEVLAHAVRNSPLKNISLRSNRIAPSGAVAIALMIKDYPDTTATPSSPPTSLSTQSFTSSPSLTPTHSATSSPLVSPSLFLTTSPNHPNEYSPLPTPTPITAGVSSTSPGRGPAKTPFALRLEMTARAVSSSNHSNPSQTNTTATGTTYTPYIPRSRRGPPPRSPPGAAEFPLITSSVGGGVTTRHNPHNQQTVSNQARELTTGGGLPSMALLDKVRALDLLPRLGALRTLDLRANDIRTGLTYISQVLKRNRTLKVLNLTDNKIGVDGLVAIAEALKYNSCLETLDLSRNPCCGPALDGVTSLRTAFTLNTALKRLFLSSTMLTSPGAIMLAEFLPESTSLLHLDLTKNQLDLAGVMALSVGLKANDVMRCLDLNIPAGDEEMARLSRDILGSCVRNTERAEERAKGEGKSNASGAAGVGRSIWGMIEDSALARGVTDGEGKKSDNDVIANARILQVQLENLLSRPSPSSLLLSSPPSYLSASWSSHSSQPSPTSPIENDNALLKRANLIMPSLISLIQSTQDPVQLQELLSLNDTLAGLISRADPNQRTGLGIILPNGSPQSGPYPSTVIVPEANGHANGATERIDGEGVSVEITDEEDEGPVTPKIDKGKGKAIEPLLTSGLGITGSFGCENVEESRLIPEPGPIGEDANGDHHVAPSPTDMSRSWVEEEGEIFRKGVVLLGPDEMEGEYAGDELRRELLEAQVERPPQRVLESDLDSIGPAPSVIDVLSEPPMSPPAPRSPRSPRLARTSQDGGFP